MWTPALAFAAVAALLTITPGIDTALVIRSTLAGGRAQGTRSAAGICCGLLVWGVLSALGVSAVLAASSAAYDAVRIAGAVYLLLLGARTLLRTMRDGDVDAAAAGSPGTAPAAVARGRTAFGAGMMSNLLNPKVGVFYVTLLPQFIPAHAPVLPMSMLLAGIHAVEGIVWLSMVALLVSRARVAMQRPAVRRGLERLTGVVLIGFGVRIALERG